MLFCADTQGLNGKMKGCVEWEQITSEYAHRHESECTLALADGSG